MTTALPTLCLACSRLSPTTDANVGGRNVVRCAAFPDGIPVEIRDGGDHREPRGDEVGGLVFDLADGQQIWLDAWLAYHAALQST